MTKKVLSIAGGMVVILFTLLFILYSLFTGPEDLSLFMPRETSPYVLPYPKGVSRFCVQGVRGIVSHRGKSRYAYDFYMPVGSDICAARAGKATKVVDSYDGNGVNWPNNVIWVLHEDGTRACYAHIRKGGAKVKTGQQVVQGEVIAASGNVGNSMMPHLHFHVFDPESDMTQPISFYDVRRHAGVPRMFHWYISQESEKR